MDQPDLRIRVSRSATTRTVVVVLHGGQASSTAPVRSTQLAFRRMLPLARAAHHAAGDLGTAVLLLRNRVRGWNAPRLDAVADARWALRTVRRFHPRARLALIGHSMGGRAALHLADEPGVRAVCALAPWTEPNDPVAQLVGRDVLIVHGDRDRVTPHSSSRLFAERAHAAGADVSRHVVEGAGHAMLRRARRWNEYVRFFAQAQAEGVRSDGS